MIDKIKNIYHCYTLLTLLRTRSVHFGLPQTLQKPECVVYKIPYRRARAWPSARVSKGILHATECDTIVSFRSIGI